ncbi:uncharacterized protein DUF1266 [Herbihabitans rhizosphaerae]|uniref:Uncharacterized protein DUF1266 n=1 Tax=Herbihabitans rhizosphaerae TaxID=1872711 RepID=A0A4V2ESB7_9PSEU|nr:DUF1266 domain-containing protein [Herbihabitans rhizosphaerae]RZS37013.1 uncharacterized protein DUF1266 [Herbihabitans rhizosphaerae]
MVCCHNDDKLITSPRGPFYGPLAYGFACGAHLAVHNNVMWNALGDPVADYENYTSVLKQSWEITTPEQWREAVDHLLSGENTASDGSHIVLGLRAQLFRQGVRRVDLPTWRDAIVHWAHPRQVPVEVAGELINLAGAVLRYEARFRADRLLPPEGTVHSTVAYDFGRAVNMARWGVGARLADPKHAEWCVVRAGSRARDTYASWQEYSAGYVLGRVIRFDDEQFSTWYDHALRGHRFLLSEPGSPWLHLSFR